MGTTRGKGDLDAAMRKAMYAPGDDAHVRPVAVATDVFLHQLRQWLLAGDTIRLPTLGTLSVQTTKPRRLTQLFGRVLTPPRLIGERKQVTFRDADDLLRALNPKAR